MNDPKIVEQATRLTRDLGITLGVTAILINLIIYTWLLCKIRYEQYGQSKPLQRLWQMHVGS